MIPYIDPSKRASASTKRKRDAQDNGNDGKDDGSSLIYIDRHLVHEVTSPQAFEGLRISNRVLRRPDLTLAVADHNVPTENRINGIKDNITYTCRLLYGLHTVLWKIRVGQRKFDTRIVNLPSGRLTMRVPPGWICSFVEHRDIRNLFQILIFIG